MGNTQGARQEQDSPDLMGTSPPDSPSAATLTFSPQASMMPQAPTRSQPTSIPNRDSPNSHTQPNLVPTFITWSYEGNQVEVQGSYDNWSTRTPLHRQGDCHTLFKLLPPGVYQYKFIVDGVWQHAPELPAMYDELGNVNNVLEVQEHVPENLESLASFQAPASPPDSYNQLMPSADDYAKEPPAVPPQALLTVLNAPPPCEGPNLLPRPQYVVLNHVYCEKSKHVWGTRVIGCTQRYRGKYATVVMYKPDTYKPSSVS
ncbi:hypothetical protein CYMTET_56958 [Cymbomonas tetramitiformis]|uniref:Association with the SNF1 complex (ASC) domain-containing protein n=1 Tax=Cymbomonas tetramitiformis TaxID=36881 RepID=A0AAE0EM24_9CHLO|nr:hypothetical protein CYMTET_56958 [Cymbomonas tetramitiformis]